MLLQYSYPVLNKKSAVILAKKQMVMAEIITDYKLKHKHNIFHMETMIATDLSTTSLP